MYTLLNSAEDYRYVGEFRKGLDEKYHEQGTPFIKNQH